MQARSLLIDACDAGAFASCDIMPIVKEYRESSVGFKPGNRWSLYNAVTWVGKKFTAPKLDNCLRTLADVFEFGSGETIDTTAVLETPA